MYGALHYNLAEAIKAGTVLVAARISIGPFQTATQPRQYAIIEGGASSSPTTYLSSWDAAGEFIAIVGSKLAAAALDRATQESAARMQEPDDDEDDAP